MMTMMNQRTIMIIVMFLMVTMCSCSSHDHLQEDPLSKNYHNSDHYKLFDRRERVLGVSVSSRFIYTVDAYGAQANGGDDTKAFKRAWKAACGSKNGLMIVPSDKVYHVKPITFEGPCKSTTTIKIYGTIRASTSKSAYDKDPRHWLLFENVHRLTLEGGGVVNGNGQVWWNKPCKKDKHHPCHAAPTALMFYECKDLKLSGLMIRNAQQIHVVIEKCKNVEVMDLKIVSPEKSPNTDGLHITGTHNITIERCVIKTGDDCISIVTGTKNVIATDIICGPGHGISIGSLGAGNSEGYVSDVYVNRAKFSGSTNGVRIKTWQGGHGYVKNVVFEDIKMNNVHNPIVIDQHYCDQNEPYEPCHEQKSAVQVSNIEYRNIRGTSSSKIAVKFDCSNRFPCRKIVVEDINLRLQNKKHGRAQALCSNVKLERRGRMSPGCF